MQEKNKTLLKKNKKKEKFMMSNKKITNTKKQGVGINNQVEKINHYSQVSYVQLDKRKYVHDEESSEIQVEANTEHLEIKKYSILRENTMDTVNSR
jgi:hypothetical protein